MAIQAGNLPKTAPWDLSDVKVKRGGNGNITRRAKVIRPQLTPGLVPRPRLARQLDMSLDRPLVLVIGPAGFGKTTLLVDWLAHSSVDSAWYTLDSDDNELDRFVTQLVAAIQIECPAGDVTLHALQSRKHSAAFLGAMLGDELLDLTQDLVLVLDDYHEIAEEPVHEFLAALLQYPPPRLHLVLCARSDPPLAHARLRGRGLVAEIRAADLRFTPEETGRLLANFTNEPIDEQLAETLHQRTDGWVAGLQLAAVALRSTTDRSTLAESVLAIGDRHVMDFLVEEVLARQAPLVQDFLLRTSIVDRVCARLGSALSDGIPTGSAEAMLEDLARSDLYVEQRGDEPGWYRLHPLFHELFRHRLAIQVGDEGMAELHRRAGIWFADQAMIEEAVVHAVAGGDLESAGDLVELHVERALATEQWAMLDTWLRKLPEGLVSARPTLLLARARLVRWRSGVLSGMRTLLRDVDALLESQGDNVPSGRRAETALFQTTTLLFDSNVETYLTSAERALEQISPPQRFARGRARFWLARALQASGQLDTAVHRITQELDADAGRVDTATIFGLLGLATSYRIQGNFDDAAFTANYAVELAAEHDLKSGLALGQLILGSIAYELNDLEGAITHFQAASACKRRTVETVGIEALEGLALAYQHQGKEQDAANELEQLRQLILEVRSLELLPELHAFEAHLALAGGDRERAIHWLASSGTSLDLGSLSAIEVPLLTRVKVLLAEASDASIDEAQRHIDAVLERAIAIRDVQRQVQGLNLRAIAHHAQGRRADGNAALADALRLGGPLGMVRSYLDAGPRLVPLLRDAARANEVAAYAARVLSAFGGMAAPQRIQPNRSRFQIFEMLTEREAQILLCLSRQLTNQEIADELYISPLTVKRHNSNIYDKLGVANRRQALIKADEMGLLPMA
jgi:LuxR family maltose regulon positive regulatory protein